MATAATVRRELKELRKLIDSLRATQANPLLEQIAEDPSRILSSAGMEPDEWQTRLLRTDAQRILLLCSRQAGKSTTAAALALRTALLQPGSLVLLLSPTLRQSGELFKSKVMYLYNCLNRPVPTRQESALTVQLANNSRIVSLPGDEATIRGYSGVDLLVIDEASRVTDTLYRSVRPMLAVSGGRLVALSTPWGRMGWYYEAWHSDEAWDRVRVEARDCRRIDPAFLAEERAALGERFYRQEYECSFENVIDAVFRSEDIESLIHTLDDADCLPFVLRSLRRRVRTRVRIVWK
jgi:hypothetical protein